MILLAREEERTKQRRPRGLAQMEPHQIAWSTRPMRAQRRRQRKGGAALFGRRRNGGWRWQEQAVDDAASDKRRGVGGGGGHSDNVCPEPFAGKGDSRME